MLIFPSNLLVFSYFLFEEFSFYLLSILLFISTLALILFHARWLSAILHYCLVVYVLIVNLLSQKVHRVYPLSIFVPTKNSRGSKFLPVFDLEFSFYPCKLPWLLFWHLMVCRRLLRFHELFGKGYTIISNFSKSTLQYKIKWSILPTKNFTVKRNLKKVLYMNRLTYALCENQI